MSSTLKHPLPVKELISELKRRPDRAVKLLHDMNELMMLCKVAAPEVADAVEAEITLEVTRLKTEAHPTRTGTDTPGSIQAAIEEELKFAESGAQSSMNMAWRLVSGPRWERWVSFSLSLSLCIYVSLSLSRYLT